MTYNNNNNNQYSCSDEHGEQYYNCEATWSNENFSQMAQLWGLTDEEQVGLKDLQHSLRDIQYWKNDPYELVRLYTYLEGDVSAVKANFRSMVQWRQQTDRDLFYQQHQPHPLFDFFPSAILRHVDREGDPIFLERLGRTDAHKLWKNFGTEAFINAILHKREVMFTRLPGSPGWQQDVYEKEQGCRVKQFTIIFDMEGFNYKQHLRGDMRPMFQELSRMIQDNYAGLAKRIILLRAPIAFQSAWRLARRCVDPEVQKMVVVTSCYDYLTVLDQYMDLKVLPSVICPKQGKGGVMPGFENVVWDGGALPKSGYTRKWGNEEESDDNSSVASSSTSTSSGDNSHA